MKPKDLALEDISVGDSASLERVWTEHDVASFAALSGDANPLHMDEAYAASTKFGKRVVHGMLVGSLCSTLVGMHIPGKRCLYLKQDLAFRKPVFIGDKVVATATVSAKSDSTRVLEIRVSIKKEGEEVVGGTSIVQVLV